jgi:hypothetical protein
MNTVIRTLLFFHVLSGCAAFVAAPIALATVKGGKAHRSAGKFYFWSMAVVAVTAIALGILRPILFLALVAVFSFYSAFSGYRVLFRKRPSAGQGPKLVDWVVAIATFVASLSLFIVGTFFRVGSFGKLGWTAGLFGVIGMAIASGDLRQFLRPPTDKNFWWYSHMGGMIGSYIAAMTAFSAVVIGRFVGQTPLVWFWPTAMGVPLLLAWQGKYRRKFERARSAAVKVGG